MSRVFRAATVISAIALSIAALGTSACTRVKAKSAPELPPLDMPAPPPRDVDTTEPEPVTPIPLIAEPARNAPARPRPAPPRERVEPPKAEAPKPDVPTTEAPPVTEEPRPAAPTLQTTPAGEERDLERAVRSTMSKANADLSHVDYRTLNADARTQYDYAKRFIKQAEEAVRAKNLVYAKTVADKAAAIAAQLTAR